MRRSWRRWGAVALLCGGLVSGCAGDIGKQVASNAETRAKVMDAIGGSDELAGQMVDRLLGGPTRGVVLERVVANGPAIQALMGRMAQDQTMLDGVINLAVQDSSMRGHVMTLFKGMQMMRGK